MERGLQLNTMLLLYAFRDLWKEWGDLFTELLVPGGWSHWNIFNVLLYIILSTTVSFFRGYHIIFTQSPLFFIFVYISIFFASTLCMCVMYLTSFDGFF